MRKRLLLLLLLASYTFLSAQHSTLPVVEIKQIPPQGIVLDKGWRLISGGNPAYADPIMMIVNGNQLILQKTFMIYYNYGKIILYGFDCILQ